MKTDVLETPVTRSRVLDYIELMKPELTGLSTLTTVCGYYLASTGGFDVARFFHVSVGTLLVGGGAGALNQFVERDFDALMKRTERRPLPSGRILPIEALLFGIGLTVVGILQLTIFANALTGFLAALTFATYLFFYTPMKRITPLSTVIGGIPGAIPPMMGWTAVRGEITVEAWILFAILFCWQMPHFYSLAWMYRKDYARAGYRVLTVSDTQGTKTSRQILFYCLALIPVSLAPAYVGLTGTVSSVGAVLLGAGFLTCSLLLAHHTRHDTSEALVRVNATSRQMFFASLLYLPALMLLMSLDKLPR
jgi:protoheme IX farnesyltransferase